MKKISKNLLVAGLGLAMLTNISVFAENNKKYVSESIVNENSLRASNLDYKNLKPGEYNIDMVIKQHGSSKKNKVSMMNQGVVDKKVIVDSTNQYYLEITMSKIEREDKIGYLDRFCYYDNNNNQIEIKVDSFMKEKEEYRKVKFPINKPTDISQRLKIKIYSNGMDLAKKGKGWQIADPVLDWSTITLRK